MSLYEVSDIVRGESFLARDLVRGGEPVRVVERSGKRYLKPWDRIAARIVTLGSRTEMAGGVLPFDRQTGEAVLQALRRASDTARADLARGSPLGEAAPTEILSDTEILRASAFLVTNIWLADALRRALNPTLPQMCNSDGDDIVFTTVRYPLKPEASAESIRRALATIPALRAESETFWNWIGSETRGERKEPADVRIFVTRTDDGSIVLGTLELKHDELVLEANSKERTERGRALIEPLLRELVGEPLSQARTPAELMASPPADGPKARPLELTPDEERAIVHAGMDRHYASLLDEPIPMLGDVTPRMAAKSAQGRDRLIAWLKMLENGVARHGPGTAMAGYDVTWMWKELGVAELRR